MVATQELYILLKQKYRLNYEQSIINLPLRDVYSNRAVSTARLEDW